MTRLTLPTALATALCLPAFAEGDAGMGGDIAREYCVECHDISADGAFKQSPPSFAAIAVYRSDEQVRARIEAPPTHAGMPRYVDYMIGGNIADMVAYIRSLEP